MDRDSSLAYSMDANVNINFSKYNDKNLNQTRKLNEANYVSSESHTVEINALP